MVVCLSVDPEPGPGNIMRSTNCRGREVATALDIQIVVHTRLDILRAL
jgi:hypothetical protein